MDEYMRLRDIFLQEHRQCAVYPNKRSTEVHHSRGRTGSLLLDTRFWFAVSHDGHRWIHDNIEAARQRGLICEKGFWGSART